MDLKSAVLDLEVNFLVPCRCLAGAVQSLRLVDLGSTNRQLQVRIHLADHLCIASKGGIDDPNVEFSKDIGLRICLLTKNERRS